jgi:hypothetical protein
VNSLVVTNIALIASALCVMVFPFCTTYPTFVATALLFGFFVGKLTTYPTFVATALLFGFFVGKLTTYPTFMATARLFGFFVGKLIYNQPHCQ